MRSRDDIIRDQKAFGAGGGNSLLLEVLMDIRALLAREVVLLEKKECTCGLSEEEQKEEQEKTEPDKPKWKLWAEKPFHLL